MSARWRFCRSIAWALVVLLWVWAMDRATSRSLEHAGAGPALIEAIKSGWHPGPPPKRPERP